jgi:C1A family cysteine protease
VVFGTEVSEKFAQNVLPDSRPLLPPSSGSIAGGHAMVVAGYHHNRFDILNSWGAGWGTGGWCSFAPEYLTWEETRDIWVVDVAPAFGQEKV